MFEPIDNPSSARERIVETAMRLFYANGVRATGIDRIIEEAGVAKMSFYRHFPSKDALVAAFLEERHRRWMAWFERATQDPPPRGQSRLEAVSGALLVWFADPGFRGCAFINVCAEDAEPGAAVRCIARDHKSDLLLHLRKLAVADGLVRPDEAAALALVIVEGAIVRADMTRDGRTAAAQARRLLRLVAAAHAARNRRTASSHSKR